LRDLFLLLLLFYDAELELTDFVAEVVK